MGNRVWLVGVGTIALIACGGENPSSPPPPPPNVPSVTLEADRDNTLFEDPTGQFSNGAGSYLFAGMTNEPTIRRGLIHFNLAGGGIPAGSRIDSARLTLRMSRTNAPANIVQIRRLTADWGEGSSDADDQEGKGAPATAGDATWVHRFFDTTLWTTPGGDFAPTASASTIVGVTTGAVTWNSTAAMVADIRGWRADPASNFGWILIGDESGSATAKRFDSHENTTSNGPRLTVFYTEP